MTLINSFYTKTFSNSFYITLSVILSLRRLNLYKDNSLIPPHNEIMRYIDAFSKSNRVVIIGTNPSNKSPDNSAFHPATKSRKTIDQWFFHKSTKYDVLYINLIDKKTTSNRELTALINANMNLIVCRMKNLASQLEDYKIVTVGKIPSDILTKNNIKHFSMPHPSGLNRFWNSRCAAEAKIKEMIDWINL